MTESLATNQSVLREAAYDADDDLRVRRETHVLYSELKDNFHEWVIDQLPYQPDMALLDVGTGPGDFPRLLRRRGHRGGLIGCDLSEGMIQTARSAAPDLPWLVTDVQALPFSDGAFDGVLPRHMLYHVPDIPCAVAELARVTRPGGWLAAVTNAANSMSTLLDIWEEVESPLLLAAENISARFPLEGAAAYFEPYFAKVVTLVRDDAFLFPSPEPIKAYLASGRHLRLAPGHTEEEWQHVRSLLFQAADRVWEREARDGTLRVSKSSGIVLATARQSQR